MRPQGTARTQQAPVAALAAASEGGLGRIIERAGKLAALEERLRRCLPEPLQAHCRLGNAGAGKLVYLVESPVWGARLRQHANVLLDAAAAAGIQAGALTVKVVPPPAPEPAAKTGKPLSQATRDVLRKTAESVADPALREQLLRLASGPNRRALDRSASVRAPADCADARPEGRETYGTGKTGHAE